MVSEALDWLAIRPEGTYLDATAGLGGHSREIAGRLSTGRLIANDRDPETLEILKRNTAAYGGRIRHNLGRFSELEEALGNLGIARVDGLLADLGASYYQLTDPERGFSFQSESSLDMRMNRREGPTASELVNTMSERDLAGLIGQLGERRPGKVARAIVRARPYRTTRDLTRVIERVVPRTGRLDPATRTFLALRLAVNEELEELDALLEAAPRLVRAGGRLVVIAFMSLEDVRVKRCFQALAREGRAKLLTKHVVRPTAEETRRNSPSRSARLRAVEMY